MSLVIGALGVEVLKRYAPGFAGNSVAAYILSIAVSLLGVFVFVLAIYRVLTNAPVTVRDVLPGAVMAAIVLEASFQVVPVFVRFAGVNPVLRVLGGPVILLLWLYLMANVIVLGAELNWWQSERRGLRHRPRRARQRRVSARAARARCECRRLPLVAELGDGALLSVRDEDRVVAESLRCRAARARSGRRAMPVPRSSSPSGASATSSET